MNKESGKFRSHYLSLQDYSGKSNLAGVIDSHPGNGDAASKSAPCRTLKAGPQKIKWPAQRAALLPMLPRRLRSKARRAQKITARNTHFMAPACAISRGNQVPAGTCRQLPKVAAPRFEKIHTEVAKCADFKRVDYSGILMAPFQRQLHIFRPVVRLKNAQSGCRAAF